MKKNILFLLIGFVLAFSIAATTTENLFVVKPATPKAVFVDWYRLQTSAVDDIKKYTKEGYVLKEMVGSKDIFIVVMEKY